MINGVILFFLFLNLNQDLNFDYTNQLNAIDLISNVHEQEKAFEYFYNNTFQPQLAKIDLYSYSENQIKNITNTFYGINFYIQNKSFTEEYLKYFNILVENNWALKNDYQKMFGVLINSRMFEQAKAFHDQYQQFDLPDWIDINIPTTIKSSQKHIFKVVNLNKKILVQEVFKISDSYEILVSAHPGCHFTIRALNDIKSDDSLTIFLSSNSRWLIAPSTRWNYNDVSDWNDLNPQFELKYVNRKNDFPMINYWGTPSFYFLNNGVVVDEVIGWPEEGKIKELKERIKKHFSIELPVNVHYQSDN